MSKVRCKQGLVLDIALIARGAGLVLPPDRERVFCWAVGLLKSAGVFKSLKRLPCPSADGVHDRIRL